MKKRSLICSRWWLLILFGIPLLFMLPLLAFEWRAIENDVANNATADMQGLDSEWVNLTTFNRGRHVLIDGLAPNQQAIDKVYDAARLARGVDEVTISAKVEEVAPKFAQFTGTVSGNKITLAGEVSSQTELNSLVNNAKAAFGKTNVINQLTVGDNTAVLPNTSNLMSLLANNAKSMQGLKATILNNDLIVNGTAISAAAKSSLESDMRNKYKGDSQPQMNIAALAPKPKPLIISKAQTCQQSINKMIEGQKINFQSGKSLINSDSYALLDSIRATMDPCQDIKFEIAGHTDSVGSLELNMSLSQKRAQAVADHLVKLGLKSTQFDAKGYGPTQPVADNSSAEGRAINRRIEFKLKD